MYAEQKLASDIVDVTNTIPISPQTPLPIKEEVFFKPFKYNKDLVWVPSLTLEYSEMYIGYNEDEYVKEEIDTGEDGIWIREYTRSVIKHKTVWKWSVLENGNPATSYFATFDNEFTARKAFREYIEIFTERYGK